MHTKTKDRKESKHPGEKEQGSPLYGLCFPLLGDTFIDWEPQFEKYQQCRKSIQNWSERIPLPATEFHAVCLQTLEFQHIVPLG